MREATRQVLILVGGQGTRLGAATRTTPKPLLPVAGRRPFLDLLIAEFARQGFDDVVLIAGHLGEQVVAAFHGRRFGEARIRVLCEERPLGTGGALRHARGVMRDRFVVANGDSFLDANIRAFAATELDDDAVAMMVRTVADGSRYGSVAVEAGRVTRFLEKDPDRRGPSLISAGIYLASPRLAERVAALPCSLESEVFPALAREGRLRAQACEGFFIDIGLPESLAQARAVLPDLVRRPAVFFDRDGVLNVDSGYVGHRDAFAWMPGGGEAVRRVNDLGLRAVVVTNQAGIARGYYTEDDVRSLHAFMAEELARAGAFVDRFYYCPYHVEAVGAAYRADHPERKPAPGMVLRAAAELDIDLAASVLIGDKPSDIACATRAGIGSVLVGPAGTGAALDAALRLVGLQDGRRRPSPLTPCPLTP